MLPVEQHCKYVLCIPRTLHGTPLEHLGNRTTNDDDAVHVKRLGKIGSIDPKLQKMKKGPSALLAALKLFACF